MIYSQQKDIAANKKNACFAQNPKIAARSIDDTVFLVDPDTDIVFYLDALGAGIWHLLQEPLSIIDATTIVQRAYPDTPPEKIAGDVTALINAMRRKNLVLNDA